MLNKDDFGNLINGLKGKLNEESGALISDDLISVISNYNNSMDEIEKLNNDINSLKSEKEDLLKVNGQLYQRIGFEKEEEKKEEEKKEEEKEEVSINDIINEKGELI